MQQAATYHVVLARKTAHKSGYQSIPFPRLPAVIAILSSTEHGDSFMAKTQSSTLISIFF